MTQIKICGITNQDDALFSVTLGTAALGFIFYPPSPRYIKPEVARQIISALPDEVIKVGVFLNENVDEIKRVMKHCALDMIQLHGDESPDYCRQFPAAITIKAVELKNDDNLNYAFSYDVAAILVDSRHGNLYGGTGKQSNWELACRLKNKKPLILSGGLNGENVAEALRKVTPTALDINSGVESSPGRKDHAKLSRIFDIISAADTVSGNAQLIFTKRK
ncbi:MAG: phosphoribosylanthranilate isomerase [Deltaproteobacteria bacterium]|nr:phosphoribosylanthranilate isomerase [Deltaproteobacteria bacterium]